MRAKPILRKIRVALGFVMFGLFVSGVTAFPLLHEMNFLSSILTDGSTDLNPASYQGLTNWILTVREGLEVTYDKYPFLGYGYDWLAFAHLMIMLYFILPYRDPIRYEGVMKVGIWSSVLVFPLAFICGALREIPFYWRIIDCLFGVFCIPPLLYALWQTRKLKAAEIS